MSAEWPKEKPLSPVAKAIRAVCSRYGDPIRMNKYYEALAKAAQKANDR